MKFSAVWVLALIFSAGPLFAQKIYIDYDMSYDGSTIKTFAWKETAETSVARVNPLMHSRIVNGIEYYLALSGAHETDANPDVYVTYHGSTEEEIYLDTDYYGYGYPSHWGYYGHTGYGAGVTTVRKYEIGTLVVDVWDAASNKLIWRGTATNITVTDNPAKMEKKLNKALKKMVGQWRKIKASNAK
jgi:hypothetical protein